MIDPDSLEARARAWIDADPDSSTRGELEELLARDDREGLRQRFDEPLRFGTAGLRGPLGAGPARMNRLVVRRTTVGVARYLQAHGEASNGIVIGRDARHGSEAFADEAASTAAALGVPVLRFGRPLPTPITAFAVRALAAGAGVMITASHNPAPDNGYKVYSSDGAQIIPPADVEISELSADAPGIPGSGRMGTIDETELLRRYEITTSALLDPVGPRKLRMVYTPIHGVGGALLPSLLVRNGFAPPALVASQATPDPDFPTAPFPNPEEPGVLGPALEMASARGADLVIANDPDADRLAVAAKASDGAFKVLSGDELGVLLADWLIGRSGGDDRIVATTIVSSSMMRRLAAARGVGYEETLTGFKWLARAARRPGQRLLFAYEEALGYAVSEAVADKDGLSAALVVAELAANELAAGSSLFSRLDHLAAELGVHLTRQWSLRLDGADSPMRLAQIVDRWRFAPPASIGGLEVHGHEDLAYGRGPLPPTNAIVIRADGGARVIVRPSGTEPKLKAYLEIASDPPGDERLATTRRHTAHLLDAVEHDVARFCQEA